MSAVPVLGSVGNPGPQNPESKAKTNLIVNYLPHTMSEDDVKNLFSAVGRVQSCKLIKDKLSQTSLGYAFVNYFTAEDAEKAIQNLNGLPLQSKTVKVSYARPSSASIKNANLYVAHLPVTYTMVDLEALFKPFGSIITSRVLVDTATGVSRGVGFVRFDRNTEAETAISALNGKTLRGSTQPLLVKFANQPKSGQLPGASSFAAATTPSTASTSLSRRVGSGAFSSTGGPIRHAVANVRYNPVSTLVAATAASQALSQLPAAAASLGLPSNPQTWCIFVYNLPESTEDSLLYQLFSPFGAISSVRVIKDAETQKCKRYGFVNMLNYEEAYGAILHLNGHVCEVMLMLTDCTE
jgi:ELAV/HuD family splicing factor